MKFKSTFVILFFSIGILPLLAIPLNLSNLNPRNLSKQIKADNVEFVKEHITELNVDACYDISESTYSVLTMSIKLGAEKSFTYLSEIADLEKTCSSKTPLMYAVKYGQLDMVKLLVSKGAKIEAKAGTRTAIDYAVKYKQSEILEFLQRE